MKYAAGSDSCTGTYYLFVMSLEYLSKHLLSAVSALSLCVGMQMVRLSIVCAKVMHANARYKKLKFPFHRLLDCVQPVKLSYFL